MNRFIVLLTALMLFAPPAWAAITYVDAVPAGEGANVTVKGAVPGTGDPVNFLLNAKDQGQADDGKWSERPRTDVNGPSVLVSIGASDAADDDDAILWTSTPTLPAGSYLVYVFFWNGSNGGGNWDIAAAIGEKDTTADLTGFTKNTATNLEGQTQLDGYDLPALMVSSGDRRLFAAFLGMVTLETDGPITVSTAGFVQPGFTGDQRTWFDGIGYQPAEACSYVPDVTLAKPVLAGASSVTVTGVSPEAEVVKVYSGDTLIGSTNGNPPNTPDSLVVQVPVLRYNDVLVARQTINGVERCGPVSQTVVSAMPPSPYITFVDAVPNTTGDDGNTTVNGALVNFEPEGGNATTGTDIDPNTDGLWTYRTGFANGGAVWETWDEIITPEPLVTTLTLPPGTYNLYGLIWAGSYGNGPWDAAFRVGSTGTYARFSQGSLEAFSSGNVILSSPEGSEFVNPVMTREGDRAIVIAPLGQYTVDGSIDIYVLGPNRGVNDERSWYEGVGYELVSSPAPLQVSDGFGDGDRDNDGVLEGPVENGADTGLVWRTMHGTCCDQPPAEFTLQVGPDIAEPNGLGTDNALHVNVTQPQPIHVANFPATTLAKAGDFIRLTFKLRLPTVVDFGDAFRFGLFNDGGTPASLDQPDIAIGEDDFGYVVGIATGDENVDPGVSHISGSGPVYSNLGSMLAEEEVFGLPPQLPMEDPFDERIRDTLPHELSMTVIRGFAGNVYIEVAIDGVLATRTADFTLSTLTFNEVAFGTTPVEKAISYIIDGVVIESGETTRDFCGTIPPVTVVDPLIGVGKPTTVTVNGLLYEAESVNIYKNGTTLIGSGPTQGNFTQTFEVAALEPGDRISARQVVNGVESCAGPAPEVAAGACDLVPAVTIDPMIPAGVNTTLTVRGIDPRAEAVNIYVNDTTLLVSYTGTPPATPADVTIDVAPLTAGDMLTARQVINGLESCAPTTPTMVADCTGVSPVTLSAAVVGDTLVTVSGVDSKATMVKVYLNGTTLIGSVDPRLESTVTLVVPPLPPGSFISATQTYSGIEGCVATPGLPVLRTKINYVDAVPNTTGSDGNTTINGALVNTGTDGNATASSPGTTGGGNAADGFWHVRTFDNVNGGTVWETDGTSDEVTEPLVTTLTLPPGTYNFYGLFHNNNSNKGFWDVAFRVGSTGDFTIFDKTNAMLASANAREFVSPIATRAGVQWLLIAPLGQYEVDESGTISFYINGPDGTSRDDRTWFDGIGWSPLCGDPFADADGDGDVDQEDFGLLQRCLFMPAISGECSCFDLLKDGEVDQGDFDAFDACISGPMVAADPTCDG